MTAAIVRTGLPRPYPRIEHAQRFARGRNRVGGMRVHAALGLVAQRPQAVGLLPVEIEFGGVLDAQDNLVCRHARNRAFDVRRQDVGPLHLFIAKEAVGPHGVRPVATGLGDAGRGLGAQAFNQADRAPIAPGVSQIYALKFRGSPAHCVCRYEISSLLHGRDGLVYNEMG